MKDSAIYSNLPVYRDCYQIRKTMVWESGLRKSGKVSDDCLRFYPDALNMHRFQTLKNGGMR